MKNSRATVRQMQRATHRRASHRQGALQRTARLHRPLAPRTPHRLTLCSLMREAVATALHGAALRPAAPARVASTRARWGRTPARLARTSMTATGRGPVRTRTRLPNHRAAPVIAVAATMPGPTGHWQGLCVSEPAVPEPAVMGRVPLGPRLPAAARRERQRQGGAQGPPQAWRIALVC